MMKFLLALRNGPIWIETYRVVSKGVIELIPPHNDMKLFCDLGIIQQANVRNGFVYSLTKLGTVMADKLASVP